MNEAIRMAVCHSFDDLLEEYLGSFFIQLLLFLYVLQQLAALKVLHNDGHLHVLQSQAIVHSYDVVMLQ